LKRPPNIFRNIKLSFDFEETDVDVEKIPYLDKQREKSRLKRMEKPVKERKVDFVEKEKGIFERKQEIRQLPTKKKRKRAMEFLEEDDIDREAKLLKLVKKGKISEREFVFYFHNKKKVRSVVRRN
jgi:hypothetical protein